MFSTLSEFHKWYAARVDRNEYRVDRIPLDDIDGWRTDPESGAIAHRTGKFFSVRGVEITTDHRETTTWTQPIIVQPEIGILGILVTIRNGVPHFLMQAKMEPGNVNLLQLSPTVQATRSNYTRVHRGNPVPYLEHFLAPRGGRPVYDALQSEQGSWFLGKRNRNMIVVVDEEPPLHEDFCWLSLEQITQLLKVPNLVNMDSRTVLSGVPFFTGSSRDPAGAAVPLHSDEHLLSWFTEVKSRYHLGQRLLPLSGLPHWIRTRDEIAHEAGLYFSVIGVAVSASNREVGQWSQPMLRPTELGTIAFLGRSIRGEFHVLVHAKTEAGTRDVVELAPTVSCIPSNYTGSAGKPRYLDVLDRVDPADVLVDVVHSEEGGRFFQAESRYLVVDVGEDFDIDVPDDFCWMTVDQLTAFVRHGNYVNVAARCLLSCLVAEPARPTAIVV